MSDFTDCLILKCFFNDFNCVSLEIIVPSFEVLSLYVANHSSQTSLKLGSLIFFETIPCFRFLYSSLALSYAELSEQTTALGNMVASLELQILAITKGKDVENGIS